MENLCEPPVNKKPRAKAKVMKEWDEEAVFKLINLVEGEKCLWDAGDEAYHNKSMRDCAWRNIAENFMGKYSPPDLNAKWTNLRIQYRGYAARVKTKSGQGVTETPKWKFYNAMNFVGRAEVQQTQQTVSNLLLEDDLDNTSADYDLSLEEHPTQMQAATLPRRKQAVNNQAAAAQIAESMREAVETMKHRRNDVFDANTSFANFLANELRTLSVEAASSVRAQVAAFFLQCLEKERSTNS